MDPLAETLRPLVAAFDRLGIPYLVGGSLASSVRGVARATMDIDVVAIIAAPQTERLARELGADWYAEPDQMRAAIAAHISRIFRWGLRWTSFPPRRIFI